MKTPTTARALALSAPILLAAAGACAQWSSNAASNLTVADRPNDQVQPKIKPTADGGCYVSWYDNATGGYDVYLQRLNAAGVEQWPHNGILIADRGVSSTVDYDLVVDASGNAVIAYNDDTIVAGTQQIQVQKVSPAGALLWGPHGVTASDGVASVFAPPHICNTSDGNIVVGWAPTNTSLLFQKLSSGGSPQWSPALNVVETGHYEGLSDMEPDNAGGFIALWVRGSNTSPTTSSKALYTQRFDGNGAAVYAPVIVFNTTSVQNGYFPRFVPDGNGGGVYGWYEIGGSRNSYIQHVLGDGSLKFPAPVASTGVTTGRIRLGASVAFDPAAREYFLASEEGTTSTVADAVIAQKFDLNGNRLWSDSGAYPMPITAGSVPSFAQCQLSGGGCMVFCITPIGTSTGVIAASKVAPDGSIAWSMAASSTPASRSRLTSALSTQGFAMLAWGLGASGGSSDVQVQNVNADGTLGATAVCYANCDGSTNPPILNVNDFTCFLNKYAASDPTANCDESTNPPVLNVNDFTCFLNKYAAGCP